MTRRALCISIFIAATTVVAGASGRPIELPERINGAKSIVVATATDIRPRWDVNAAGDRLIFSRISLRVEETLKGTPFGSRLLDVEGGTLNGVTLHVSSLPEFKPGERA